MIFGPGGARESGEVARWASGPGFGEAQSIVPGTELGRHVFQSRSMTLKRSSTTGVVSFTVKEGLPSSARTCSLCQ